MGKRTNTKLGKAGMKPGRRYIAAGKNHKGEYVRKVKKNGKYKYVYTSIRRSLKLDVKKKAKTKVKSGYGHKGDQKRR